MADEAAITDVFASYSRCDRILALQEGLDTGQIAAGANEERLRETVAKLGGAARAILMGAAPVQAAETQTAARVGIRELCRYLSNPADAALKRHLHVQDEDEEEPSDDEPFYTERKQTCNLVQDTLSRFVGKAAAAPDLPQPDVDAEFAQAYENRRRQGQAPDGDFAALDRARLRLLLRERIGGAKGALAEFIRERKGDEFCGPARIGPSRIPIGAKTVFPALRFAVPGEAIVSGTWDLVWRAEGQLEVLRILQGVGSNAPIENLLSWHLFEPVLFYLALLAGSEKNADGVSSSEWLKGRPLRVTLAHEKGKSIYEYSGIQPDEAKRYLEALTKDFLAARCFDLLPFKVIADNPTLRAAYELPDGPELTAIERDYAALLQQAVDDTDDNDFQKDERVRPIDLLTLAVPADAFRKVRERFRLLDRGSAARRAATATNDDAENGAPSPRARSARVGPLPQGERGPGETPGRRNEGPDGTPGPRKKRKGG